MNTISGSGSSLSALRAFGVKSQVTANNVANVNTDEFKKSRADMVEGVNGGVDVAISKPGSPEKGNFKTNAPPVKSVGTENEQKEPSNVDIAEEMVNMMTTETSYSANTKMVQSRDDMLGTVIDMVS